MIELMQKASDKLSKGILKESIRENIETMRAIEQQGNEIPPPNVRVDLLDSSIGLNVLFVTDVRRVRDVRADIARGFLTAIQSHSDIQIAYPHLQVFLDKTQGSFSKPPKPK